MPPDTPGTAPGSSGDRAEIAAFWAWWREASPGIQQDLATSGTVSSELLAAIDGHLSHVNEGLSWELGHPESGAYLLVVTANGNDLLFAPAARLIAAAPTDDPAWRFFSSKPPLPRPSKINVDLGGRQYTIAEARFSLDARADDELVDLTFDHPATRGLPSGQAHAVAFLLLDALLGEDAVERHIGKIDVGRIRFGAKDYRALLLEVARMAELRADRRDRGVERYAFLDTARDGLPGVATVIVSRTHRDHPTFDTRAEMRIALRDPMPNGLVSNDEAETLNKLQDGLEQKLGHRAVVTSRETQAGYRVINFAFDGDGPVGAWFERLPDVLKPSRSVEVSIRPDPGWEHARALVDRSRGSAPR